MKRTILALFFVVISSLSFSQSTITIGTDNSTNALNTYPAPYGNLFFGARHQILIRSSELTSAGMGMGDIESIALNVDSVNGVTLENFTIGIRSTLATDVSAGWEGGMSTVWGPLDYTETVGWNIHTFSSPFYWDGISNILVEICFNNSSSSGNALTYFSSTSYQSVRHRSANNGFVCNSVFNSQLSNSRPNVQFVWTSPQVPPVANFIANPAFSCNGIVELVDLSEFDPTDWQWDFGDSGTYNVQNPTHTYANNGTYTVTLIATNQYGSDTLVMTNLITVDLNTAPPIASSCTPQSLGTQSEFGISLFVFGTISISSQDAATEGYADRTCFQTIVTEGQAYQMNVVTDEPTTHNIRAWIDYNNDGELDAATEEVLSENSTLQASAMINIPSNAILNTPLRVRVSADYDFSPVPGPCSDLQFGQAEDYAVIIEENTLPPIAEFSASPLITCDGVVQFTDLSTNVPTDWSWDFGDFNSSSVQNPTHTYSNNGTYTVELTVTNANGSDMISYVNLIVVNTAGSVLPANCTPTTLAYCCDYGIYSVDFVTISNSSDNASEGYQDFSCQNQTTVTEGDDHLISIGTGSINAQDTRVWIDLNNDGDFITSEIVFDAFNESNPSGIITIPNGLVFNTPLRMRIVSDVIGNVDGSCDDQNFGQTEDYGIIIEPTTLPPVAFFTSDIQISCEGIFQFFDQSTNAPNQWLWDFGDLSTSTNQNPIHTYNTPGIYTVSLTATNLIGSDDFFANDYIEYMVGPFCDTILLPTNGQGDVYTTCEGVVMDDGGYDDYSPGADGWITISPIGAETVTLLFQQFQYEPNSDFLVLYDGPDITSPIIGTFSGFGLNVLPNNGVITSSGPSITIQQQTTNGFLNFAGFLANWECSYLGIEEQVFNNTRIFPNPTHDQLTIEIGNIDHSGITLTVTNIIGKEFLTDQMPRGITQHYVSLKDLESGVYLITMEMDGVQLTKKIILN